MNTADVNNIGGNFVTSVLTESLKNFIKLLVTYTSLTGKNF